MKTCFVDTKLFIRYLTDDDPVKADRVERLLDSAGRGDVRLVTTELVIAETVWVLESGYGLAKCDVAPMIRAILATSGLDVLNGALVSKAVEYYESKNVDFVDGYIAAVMEKNNINELFSFDKKHIGRLPHISRKEP